MTETVPFFEFCWRDNDGRGPGVGGGGNLVTEIDINVEENTYEEDENVQCSQYKLRYILLIQIHQLHALLNCKERFEKTGFSAS